jgi:hypothetical protein
MGATARSTVPSLPPEQALRELARLLAEGGSMPRRLLLVDADGRPLRHRMVGSHHRLRVGDLSAYRARQRAAVRAAARLSEELGLDDA